MTNGDERIRGFIAVEVSEAIRRSLLQAVRQMEQAAADVRWVRPQGLHVTLKFLGNVAAARVEEIREHVAPVAAAQRPFDLHVRGLGGFPSLDRARVLWAGLLAEPLAQLAAAIDQALRPLGFEAETRGFQPHLTLARVRTTRRWPQLLQAAQPYLVADFGRCTIDSIVLFRSTLQPGGSVYTPLWRAPLGTS